MEIQKLRYDSELQNAANLGTDTLREKVMAGNRKLGAAATELAKTGRFADIKEFNGDPDSIKEQMSNLNTDLAAWGKELADRDANSAWAKRIEEQNKDNGGNQQPHNPSPEDLQNGKHTTVALSPFIHSVEHMWNRIAEVAEGSGLEKDALFASISGVKFSADLALDGGQVGESIRNAAFGTTSWTPESVRDSRVPMLPRHDPILPAILPVVQWGQAAYPYVQEASAFVGSGKSGALEKRGDADRSEGEKATEATMTMELATEPITSKAFTMPVHSEVFEDVPGARSHVTMRMPQLMQDVLNNSLLNGERASNATKGVVGFLNRIGTRSFEFAAGALSSPTIDETLELIVATHQAIVNQVGNAAAYPDMMLLNLELYHQIKTARDKDGRLLLGDYSGRGTDMLWGVPFTFHPNMPVNANGAKVGLMGAFRSHSAYISRKSMTLAYTESNEDEFEKLIGRFRLDVRHGMAVYRPAAFTVLKADGTTF